VPAQDGWIPIEINEVGQVFQEVLDEIVRQLARRSMRSTSGFGIVRGSAIPRA
jgi:hypothetical protein